MSKAQIQRLIDTAPSSWLKMFKRYKLGRKPTVNQLIETVLEYTPTMRSSGARGAAKHKVPKAVKKEAMDGLKLAHKHNWTSASGVGLVRAMQLVVRPKIWDRSVERMNNYFTRHARDKESNAIKSGKQTWGPRKPSRGYIAHLAWGGDSGQKWASRQVMKTNPMEKIQFGTIGRKKLFYSSDIEQNEDGEMQLTIGIWLNQDLSGVFELFFKTWEQSYYDSNCSRLMDALEQRYDVLGDAPVVHFKIGELSDDNLKGRGIGKEAYKIAISESWKYLQEPFYFASDACEEGFTSTAAGRVWKALRSTFPMASYGRQNDSMWGLSVFGIVEEPMWDRTVRPFRKKRRKNPFFSSRTTTLVPKDQVQMVGFCPKKTRIVSEHIPVVLGKIEELVGEELLFPTPIRPMTEREFKHGRTVVDNGHPNGAGHGQYDTVKMEVAINPNMEPFDLVANVFHENLHHALPKLPEEDVRDMTGYAMEEIYGVFNFGRPYAEGRLKANPRRRRNAMAPGYQSYGWTTQSWRSLFLHSDGSITYDKKCGAKGTQLKDGRPRLCLPLYVIEQLIGSKQGRKILTEQIRKKERAKKGQRVPWHPTIKALHRELESMTPVDDPRLRSRRR